MTITQTVDIPADHRLTIDVPSEIPVGRTQVVIQFPVRDEAPPGPCPICAGNIDPETGNPRYKPEVYESMQEADDMLSGKIPSTLRRFNSFDEMWENLMRDDSDD